MGRRNIGLILILLQESKNNSIIELKKLSNMKKRTISFDELAKVDRHQQPRFMGEYRRNEKGELVAHVLKRNPNYKKY